MKIKNIYKYLFLLLLPSLVVSKAANSVIFVLLALLSVFLFKKNYPKDFLKKYLFFISFFVSVLIGLLIDLYTTNNLEFKEITKRASFILMPFIIYSSRKHIQLLALKYFIYFLTLLSSALIIIGLIRSVINKGVIIYGIWDSKTTEGFYSQDRILNWGELSYKRLFLYFDMHPTYYSLFSLIVVLLVLFTSILNIGRKKQFAIITLHIIMIVLVGSKAGIVSLLFILIIKLTTGIFNKRKFIAISILLAIPILTISLIPSTQIRIKKAIASMSFKKNDLKNSSTNERIILWNSIRDFNTKELILGSGYTNSRQKVYQLTGIDKNMHNQYLQSLISSGLIGFILLIFFLFLPYIFHQNILVNIFIAIIVFNLLFENMLDRIWGIMIISIFYSLFIFGKMNTEQNPVFNFSKKQTN